VVVGVGLGAGVGVGVPPFVAPPFLTLRSLRLTRLLALGLSMGRSPSPGRVDLSAGTFRGL